MKTYTIKLKPGFTSSTYLLWDENGVRMSNEEVSDLFSTDGTAYFVFDYRGQPVPSGSNIINIEETNSRKILAKFPIQPQGAIVENTFYKANWRGLPTTYTYREIDTLVRLDSDKAYGLTSTQLQQIADEITALETRIAAAKKLSSSDYNYPEATPDGVALWKLGTGVYVSEANTKIWFTTVDSVTNEGVYIVTSGNDIARYDIYRFGASLDGIFKYTVNKTTGAYIKRVDALWSDSITYTGAGAPTTSTRGVVGNFYIDTTTQEAYICVNVSGSTYTWKQVTN